jgi:Domain of unknown function (DUF4430)
VIARAAAVLTAVAMLAAACGSHRVQPPVTAPAAPSAELLVTAAYGDEVLRNERVAPGQSVLAALEGVADVRTSYGGRFVEAIDGRAGSADHAEDWLYFVNGVEAPLGAAEWPIRDGDQIWWDYRRWRRYANVPAVVGAWPEPFVHGPRGAAPTVAADPPLASVLRAAGSALADTAPNRVLVGADSDLRARDPDWRRAASDPAAAGLTAWIESGGVAVWNADRETEDPSSAGTAVAVATATAAGGVLFVVTGVDAAAAASAADTIAADPGVLAHRYAVVFDRAGRPVAYGGTP